MDAAGVDVGVALTAGRHVIRLVDRHRARSLDVPVRRGFDREVAVLCCSLALCADVPGIVGPGNELARQWPELAGLGRLRVSGRGRPERPS